MRMRPSTKVPAAWPIPLTFTRTRPLYEFTVCTPTSPFSNGTVSVSLVLPLPA
jgi:hypothetical protein